MEQKGLRFFAGRIGVFRSGTEENWQPRKLFETCLEAKQKDIGRRGLIGKVNNMARKDSILKLRELLVYRRDALRRALAGDLSMLKSLPEQTGGDVVDAALDAAQDEISSQLAEVESRELAQIENSLERMREGTYGQCEVCEGKIPLARLNALPYAMTCIDCQRASESGGGGSVSNNWGNLIDSDLSYSD